MTVMKSGNRDKWSCVSLSGRWNSHQNSQAGNMFHLEMYFRLYARNARSKSSQVACRYSVMSVIAQTSTDIFDSKRVSFYGSQITRCENVPLLKILQSKKCSLCCPLQFIWVGMSKWVQLFLSSCNYQEPDTGIRSYWWKVQIFYFMHPYSTVTVRTHK